MTGATVLLERINSIIIKPAEGVVFALGFFMFMWGIVEFFWAMRQGSPLDTGKKHMLYGIIGMFVMIAVWGILNIVTSTFGIDVGGGSIPTSGNLNAPRSSFQLSN